jgi:hypothetical protein
MNNEFGTSKTHLYDKMNFILSNKKEIPSFGHWSEERDSGVIAKLSEKGWQVTLLLKDVKQNRNLM